MSLARIAEFNRTDTQFRDQVTLPELIAARCALHPEWTAVICDHDATLGAPSLSYAELQDRVSRLAGTLRAGGVGRGHVVALMVERSFAMIIGVLAILEAGAAYLPIAPDSPPDRLAYILQDGGVKVLLVHGKTAGRTAFGGRIIDLDDPSVYHGAPADRSPFLAPFLAPLVAPLVAPRVEPHDLAYVIYTSGSTGKPKGVMIEHRPVVNRLDWMQHAYPIGAGDVLLQKTPYYFDVSVWELFWWALQGATLCFLPPNAERMPMAIVETIRKNRVTVLHFVPSMLNVFLEYLESKPAEVVKERLATVRRVFASGEALTPSHVKKFNAVWGSRTGARLTNLYGPTEATVDVTYFDCPADGAVDTIPIGRPIHNTRMYVIRDGQQVAIGETGELCIAGVGLARGYLNNPSLTAEKFTDNPANPGERIYRTGDLARWLPDGNLEYLGREDHQVKIRGLRIELGEIENVIREYPGGSVRDCVAVVKQYSENVILIVAYLVAGPELDVEALKQHLKRHLPEYMVPHRFERLERIPTTPSGKADRKALPEPVLQAGLA